MKGIVLRAGWIVVLLVPTLVIHSAYCGEEADVPIAPIAPIEFHGFEDAIRLANENLDVVVVPAVGRIAKISFSNGPNLLRWEFESTSNLDDEKSRKEWINMGGDWIWPVAQSHWPRWGGSDWPPPAELVDVPWFANAWKSSDNSLNCRLTRNYQRPLNVKVTRTLSLSPTGAMLRIWQRAEQLRASDIPITLWNIVQVVRPDWVLTPVCKDCEPQPFRSLIFSPPSPAAYEICESVTVFRPTVGEFKVCLPPGEHWLAAAKDSTLLIMEAVNPSALGNYPDGGCALELYVNAGLGYVELETLAPEAILKVKEAVENEVRIRCYSIPTNLPPCDLAHLLRQYVVGESSPQPRQD